MGKQGKCPESRTAEPTAGRPERPVPRWTVWEVLGLLVSAILVAGPLLSLAYTFVFPAAAPAQVLSPTPESSATVPFTSWPLTGTPPNPDALLPTPTSRVTDTPTPGPSPTPTDTPTPVPTVPTVPTATPTDTPTPVTPTFTPTPATPTPTPVSPSPTPSQTFRVEKAANKDVANPGETVAFTIGLSNGTDSPVSVTVNDTLPDYFSLQWVRETCTGGSVPFSGNSFEVVLPVPAGRSCQIVAAATVVQGCNCYVRNTATWSTASGSGSASSQPVYLPISATAGPSPTLTATATASPSPTTPTPTASPSPTTPTPTASPSPMTPTPTATAGPSPTPTATATAGPSPTPTATPVTVPTNTPRIRPTERPGPTSPPDTPGPTPVCASARISGEVCAAGVRVTISSCCPPWSAQTTTNASGHFEFANLTVGTFTVQALGRSQTVTLARCDSVVRVNLCSLTPGPTALVTMPMATPPGPTGVATPQPTVPVTPGAQPPTVGDITLRLEADRALVSPGGSVTFFLTLHNGKRISALQNVAIRNVFPEILEPRGASGSSGEARLVGRQVELTAPLLAAGQELTLRVYAAVRSDAAPGTTVTLQGWADVGAPEPVYSDLLTLQVAGEAVPPVGQTPGVGPGGGPGEAVSTPPPGTGGLGGELPYTGSGVPMIGIVLGGLVLLARQVRLRRAARRERK